MTIERRNLLLGTVPVTDAVEPGTSSLATETKDKGSKEEEADKSSGEQSEHPAVDKSQMDTTKDEIILETPKPEEADNGVQNTPAIESSLDDREEVPEKSDEIFNSPDQGRSLISFMIILYVGPS